MFIGHFAPAFAAAALTPRAPKLATLFIGAQLVDWAFFALLIVGVEKMRIVPGATTMVPFDLYYMPYTHSLLGTAIWAVCFGAVVWLARQDFVAVILASLVVLSHWALDWLTHRPDLTLAGAPPALGFGLWNMPAIAIPLELGITLGAFYWYVKASRGPIGPPAILLGFLMVLQFANWFGPEPQAANLRFYLVALGVLAFLTLLAAWVGTTRRHKRALLSLFAPRR